MAPRKKNTAEAPVSAASEDSGSVHNQTTSFAKGTKSMSEGTIIELDMNLEDFEDFVSLPKGEYPGECTAAEVRTSDKGNQYFYTMWKIDPSDYPADYDVENNPEGTVLNFSRIQVPTASNRRAVTAVKKFMANLGMPLKTSTIDPSEWIGKKAKLVVTTEKYNGEDRNSVSAVESIDA